MTDFWRLIEFSFYSIFIGAYIERLSSCNNPWQQKPRMLITTLPRTPNKYPRLPRLSLCEPKKRIGEHVSRSKESINQENYRYWAFEVEVFQASVSCQRGLAEKLYRMRVASRCSSLMDSSRARPAIAIIAPLSVHRLIGGKNTVAERRSQACVRP